MHPSCALIVWFAAVLGAQFVGYAGLAVLMVLPLLGAMSAWRPWLAYAWRARWLLLALWLILAYNTPGEAWLDWAWAPTREGIDEGVLQVVRLLVLLLWLAWLFQVQGRRGLVCGLWGLLRPFERLGLGVERLVVRLSLVLDALQTPPDPGVWRRMLHAEARAATGVENLSLAVLPWTVRDSGVVLACAAGLLGVWIA